MTIQRYELQIISASIATDIDTINTTLATISGSGESFPYTGSAIISGSLTVTGSIFSNELAFLTASNAVSSSFAATASFVENVGNVFSFVKEGVILSTLDWQAESSIFKNEYFDVDILENQTIIFIPQEESVETIINNEFSSFNIVKNGSVVFFAKTIPETNIVGKLQINVII
jgi:hypothetical protein